MNTSPASLKAAAILGGVGILAYLVIKYGDSVASGVKSVAAGVGNVAQSVNPYNQDNIFYSTANAATGLITQTPDETFGGWLYDTFNPRAKDVSAMLKGSGDTVPPTVAQKTMQAAPIISPSGVLTDSKYRDMVR